MTRGAAFLDRDGTLIVDAHYTKLPEEVKLLPGAAAAVRRLNDASIPVVVVTNQSGIARGMLSDDDYQRVRLWTEDLLRAEGARIDATYVCPHHPDFTGPCACRKPGTLLFRRAAQDLGLSLPDSWYVGDKPRDVLPARDLEGRGILVPNNETSPDEMAEVRGKFDVVRTLGEAVDLILEPPR